MVTPATLTRMSEMAQERIPELTLGWRLKMALGPMHANEMAAALEISRTTISRWMSGRGRIPPTVYIRQWALITRTDPTWLLTGQQPSTSGPGNTRKYPSDASLIYLHSLRPTG